VTLTPAAAQRRIFGSSVLTHGRLLPRLRPEPGSRTL
jgi:hypothetical protein